MHEVFDVLWSTIVHDVQATNLLQLLKRRKFRRKLRCRRNVQAAWRVIEKRAHTRGQLVDTAVNILGHTGDGTACGLCTKPIARDEDRRHDVRNLWCRSRRL